MEVLKTNLVKVFFNSDTGVVAIPEDNEKGQLILSDLIDKEEKGLEKIVVSGIPRSVKYIGSDLYKDAQNYLSHFVNVKKCFSDS